MKKYSRFLSILVLLAITAGCIPFSAFAEEPLITPETIEETKIVEVVERREESIKHFRLPDGSYEAVSYAGAVHRKDANGVWQDIDNDLTLKTVGTK